MADRYYCVECDEHVWAKFGVLTGKGTPFQEFTCNCCMSAEDKEESEVCDE